MQQYDCHSRSSQKPLGVATGSVSDLCIHLFCLYFGFARTIRRDISMNGSACCHSHAKRICTSGLSAGERRAQQTSVPSPVSEHFHILKFQRSMRQHSTCSFHPFLDNLNETIEARLEDPLPYLQASRSKNKRSARASRSEQLDPFLLHTVRVPGPRLTCSDHPLAITRLSSYRTRRTYPAAVSARSLLRHSASIKLAVLLRMPRVQGN